MYSDKKTLMYILSRLRSFSQILYMMRKYELVFELKESYSSMVIQEDLEIVSSSISFGFKGWQESMPFPPLLKTQDTSSIPVTCKSWELFHTVLSATAFSK
jgi:hypothetical protein